MEDDSLLFKREIDISKKGKLYILVDIIEMIKKKLLQV